jgi:hypothetical protein
VVELFTSQSCYSCPPAEAFLGELVGRGDVIGLEFHVDYWDELVYGSSGRWRDVFSSPDHTRRQRLYNRVIRAKNQVYTPQMIIDGRVEVVGSRRQDVEAELRNQAGNMGSRLNVTINAAPKAGITVTVDGSLPQPAALWLVRYQRTKSTRVTSGENKGKTLTNHHVVTRMERIGAWSGTAMTVTVPDVALSPEEGCAVLVQDDNHGPIFGAAECPSS